MGGVGFPAAVLQSRNKVGKNGGEAPQLGGTQPAKKTWGPEKGLRVQRSNGIANEEWLDDAEKEEV